MVKKQLNNFLDLSEVSRWHSLYDKVGAGPGVQWALCQGYARRRAWDRLNLCVGLIDSYEGKNVLDLACGGGHYGVMVSSGGANYVGLDISKHMLMETRRRLNAHNGASGEVINGDINHLPLVSGSFDVIFCVGILSYFTDKQVGGIVKQLPSLLRPGGRLVLQTTRLDVVTWLRSRLPHWVPRPFRLPGPLFPRKAKVVLQLFEGSPARVQTVIEMKKLGVLPFQTVYLFEMEKSTNA